MSTKDFKGVCIYVKSTDVDSIHIKSGQVAASAAAAITGEMAQMMITSTASLGR